MPFDANQKFIFDAICNSVCPTLNKQFISQRKLKKELKFLMNIYTQTVLHSEQNEDLAQFLEVSMLDKIGSNSKTSKMYEARYRITMRAKLDANPKTLGLPTGPMQLLFRVFKLECEDETKKVKMFDEHPCSIFVTHQS